MIKTCLAALGFALISLALMSDVAYAETTGVVVGERVNVRASAEINDGNRLFQVERGHEVDIHDVSGDFFRATINDRSNVYIAREWVRVSGTRGVVTDDIVWVYNIPAERDGHRLVSVAQGEEFTVVSTYGSWFGVEFWGGTAFVPASSVEIASFVELPAATISDYNAASDNALVDDIISFARGYLGARYAFGGNGPHSFDCSGFMSYVLRNFGISVNRSSRDMARNGTHVYRNQIIPGDLVFFATSGGNRISHVGMYIGGGQLIHSSSWGRGVRLDNMNAAYYATRFVTARRVI